MLIDDKFVHGENFWLNIWMCKIYECSIDFKLIIIIIIIIK